jgi:hypothetical protein
MSLLRSLVYNPPVSRRLLTEGSVLEYLLIQRFTRYQNNLRFVFGGFNPNSGFICGIRKYQRIIRCVLLCILLVIDIHGPLQRWNLVSEPPLFNVYSHPCLLYMKEVQPPAEAHRQFGSGISITKCVRKSWKTLAPCFFKNTCIYQHPPAGCQLRLFDCGAHSHSPNGRTGDSTPKLFPLITLIRTSPLSPSGYALGILLTPKISPPGYTNGSLSNSLLCLKLLVTRVGHLELLGKVDPELQTVRVLGTLDM